MDTFDVMAGPFRVRHGLVAAALAFCSMTACATGPAVTGEGLLIDTSIVSPNQDARETFLVMHYTALSLERSLEVLTSPAAQVSAHYLVPEHAEVQGFHRIYQLVPESRRAWHAGVSFWQGSRLLNPSSIGIEIVNLGFPAEQEQVPPMQRQWYPYPPAQIEAVGKLARDIVRRHGIRPVRVIGHTDIAAGRKSDPGPLFPWERLYREYGVGAWYDEDTVAYYREHAPWQGDLAELQARLATYGYDVPVDGLASDTTTHAISAFQMHFHPQRYDGVADVETVARLDALLEKYQGKPRPVFTMPRLGQ
ncbi:MAG TPA: N-acetylmuramoyl-L-alanine amidase [Luteibacter sp.]|nr:N-acetylmuramoyl-L-alanine amidase [Luteibacter sp.]